MTQTHPPITSSKNYEAMSVLKIMPVLRTQKQLFLVSAK